MTYTTLKTNGSPKNVQIFIYVEKMILVPDSLEIKKRTKKTHVFGFQMTAYKPMEKETHTSKSFNLTMFGAESM